MVTQMVTAAMFVMTKSGSNLTPPKAQDSLDSSELEYSHRAARKLPCFQALTDPPKTSGNPFQMLSTSQNRADINSSREQAGDSKILFHLLDQGLETELSPW